MIMKATAFAFILHVVAPVFGGSPSERAVDATKVELFGSSVGAGIMAIPLIGQSIDEESDQLDPNLIDFSKDPPQKSGLRGKADTSIENIKQDPQEHRALQQPATNLKIINDCSKDVYASFKYTKNGNTDKVDPFIRQDNTFIVDGVTDPLIEIYALSFSWQTFDYDSVWPGYCNDQCYRPIYLGALNGGEIEFRLCGSPTSPPPPPVPSPTTSPTRTPTRAPTRTPTRPPTRNPTPQPTPRPIPNLITETQNDLASQWLSEHNSRRASFYAQHGLGRMDLKWADSIAASAQQYADKLIRLDGCHIEHGYGGDYYGGENLAANWGSGRFATPRTPREILTAWYDYQINLPNLGDKMHSTQVVFRRSRYLGCGQAEKDLGHGSKCFIHVCRYVSNGNCFTDGQNSWLSDVLSDDQAFRCTVDKCEDMPEGCF